MMNHNPNHCLAPGCGRFVKEGTERCDGHPDTPPDDSLDFTITVLEHLLIRLAGEENDLETQAKYIPRVSSVAIQAARTRHQIGGRATSDILTVLGPILEELDKQSAP